MEELALFEPGETGVRVITLTRLGIEIAKALSPIGRVAVEGEVVRPTRGSGGGAWFTLKDRATQISVRCPASRMRACRVVNGERVRVTGSLRWVADRGQAQLEAEEVVPTGAGAIAALLAEVKGRLVADGLVDRPRRRLPVLPTLIGVVCGTDAAVKADIESVVAARFPGYPIEFVAATLSGPGAAEAVMSAMRRLDVRPEVEVILLARGGGDATQLLPFSDEDLCRAVAACSTPVVSAIGHDGDRPLCDDVADARFGTPSLAAAAVVPDLGELRAALDFWAWRGTETLGRLTDRATHRLSAADPADSLRAGLDAAAVRLERATSRLVGAHPSRTVAVARAQFHRLDWASPLPRQVEATRSALGAAFRHLEALSPQRVLERGYAVVRMEGQNAAVRHPDEVVEGTLLDLQVASGRIAATVRAPASAAAADPIGPQ